MPKKFANLLDILATEGRIFTASDADQDDTVVGQTSFANTTPTFLLRIPSGTTALPLSVRLRQAGTVAGGVIFVYYEYDVIERYSTGGTAEKSLNGLGKTALCTLYTGATAVAGYGMNIGSYFSVPPDVLPATEATPMDWHQLLWPERGDTFTPHLIKGPGAFLVYTFAGTTGPGWLWDITWGELPSGWVT